MTMLYHPERPLYVLIIDDSEDDAMLLVHELERGGYKIIYERVDTRESLDAALDRGKWNLILADFVMPNFGGLAALEAVKERNLDAAFIMVSGCMGESAVVESMRAGAQDYVMKDKLTRLVPAVTRELNQLETRRERRRAEEELKESFTRVRRVMEGVIAALSRTTALKDPYTATHQQRVAFLAGSMALEMGMPGKQIQGLHIAALLHDIGKIAIPTEILTKPGRLSQHELSLIRTHSQCSYDILQGIEFPWPVQEIIRQHHERLDGSGYPQGLRGDQILPEARVVAVADVVESMSSHRPYRPALGVDMALQEITSKKGVLYDAKAVDACCNLFTRKTLELAEWRA